MKVEIPQILWNCEIGSSAAAAAVATNTAAGSSTKKSGGALPCALMSIALLPLSCPTTAASTAAASTAATSSKDITSTSNSDSDNRNNKITTSTSTRTGNDSTNRASPPSKHKHKNNINYDNDRYCFATAGNCTDINLWFLYLPMLGSTTARNTNGSSRSTTLPDQDQGSPTTESGTPTPTASLSTSPTASPSPTSNGNSNNLNKVQIDFICSLTRHDGSVNAVSFSPNGQHLCTASDTGTIIVWSINTTEMVTLTNSTTTTTNDGAISYHHCWANVQKESDLLVKIITSSCCTSTSSSSSSSSAAAASSTTTTNGSIMDICWMKDSKRFVIGTIDHRIAIYEDVHYNTNHFPFVDEVGATSSSPSSTIVDSNSVSLKQQRTPPPTTSIVIPSEFKCIYSNQMGHNHYIQGITIDPIYHCYIVSQSSDRTIRVWNRNIQNYTSHSNDNNNDNNQILQQIMTKNKFEMVSFPKTKQIKYRPVPATPTIATTPITDGNNITLSTTISATAAASTTTSSSSSTTSKQNLFLSETSCESFVRRLRWTSDGHYLIVPSAIWSTNTTIPSTTTATSATTIGTTSSTDTCTTTTNPPPQQQQVYATLIYQRHLFDEPYKVLCGFDKPTIAVCVNPVFFNLLPNSSSSSIIELDDKNNETSTASTVPSTTSIDSTTTTAKATVSSVPKTSSSELRSKNKYKQAPKYRNIFAVLTWDSVLIYDTVQDKPLAIARGIHYANIVDGCWTSDGHTLLVCSTDGYISILRFTMNELGTVYHPPPIPNPTPTSAQSQHLAKTKISPSSASSSLPSFATSSPSTAGQKRTLPEIVEPKESSSSIHSEVITKPAVDIVTSPNVDAPSTTVAKTISPDHDLPTNVATTNRASGEQEQSTIALTSFVQQQQQQVQNVVVDDQQQYRTPPPQIKKQKKRIQPIQLITTTGSSNGN